MAEFAEYPVLLKDVDCSKAILEWILREQIEQLKAVSSLPTIDLDRRQILLEMRDTVMLLWQTHRSAIQRKKPLLSPDDIREMISDESRKEMRKALDTQEKLNARAKRDSRKTSVDAAGAEEGRQAPPAPINQT